MPKLLDRSFFLQETTHVAEHLLGCYLHRCVNGQSLLGRIVETEAYLGLKDPCCHSYGGRRTPRNQSMYLPGGYSYVYFIYGMHYCFNVVTGGEDQPEAVLIRSLEPLGEGVSEMRKQRGNRYPLTKLCNGPAKLCQAFSITKSLNGKDLSREGTTKRGGKGKAEIYLSWGKKPKQIATDMRVGLPLKEDSSYWPLRFYDLCSPFVSLRRAQIL